MPKTPKRPTILERDLQRQIERLFGLAGCVCYSTNQGYRKEPGGTRMTPGLPDLLVFLPALLEDTVTAHVYRGLGFFEVKTPDGLTLHRRGLARGEKRAQHQALFQKRCIERGIPHGLGGMDEAWAFLASVGLAERTDVAPVNGVSNPLSSSGPVYQGLTTMRPQWRLTPRPR